MKKRFFQRVVSAFLAIAMVFTLVPAFEVAVGADTNVQITNIENMGQLGKGFNLLGDQPLDNTTMADKRIFKSVENIYATNSDVAGTEYLFTYINDMKSYLQSESASASVSLEASTKIKILSLEAKYKYGIKAEASSLENSKTEYAILSVLSTYAKKYMDLSSEKYIERLWQQNEDGTYVTLDDDFVDELYAAGASDAAMEAFFEKYGTHIVTRYVSGGEAYLVYSGTNLSSKVDGSSSWEQNATVSGDLSGFGKLSVAMETAGAKQESVETSETDITISGSSRGGKGTLEPDNIVGMINGGSTDINGWATTIDASNSQILVDDRPEGTEDTLRLLPIWELLCKPEDAVLRASLEEYYIQNVNAQYADFYADYIYSASSSTDYTDFTFIRTAQEFNNIRNNLSGNYVLLNDIDLSGYSEWTPIGENANAAFTGIFDGNGNTISGLNITKCNSYAGLFGYNKGTIKNVAVSGKIDADGTGSANNVAYIGGIVGYNAGTISNCRNMVAVNGKMTVTEEETANAVATTENFFTKYSAAIENAKKTTAQTIANNGSITVNLPVRLTGTSTGVTINVTGEQINGPAFIVLENANITGTIIHNSSREVCIISIGDSNSITGSVNKVAVNVSSTSLYIVGNAELMITGGKGADGAAGSDGVTGGTDVRSGTEGSTGNPGKYAVSAKSINFFDANVKMTGGSGGNGGRGGNGAEGKRSNNPTGGGHGANGGKGGSGENAIDSNVVLSAYGDSAVVIKSGNGGNGGKGGNGGNGGYNTFWLLCDTTNGGNAGSGGAGGSSKIMELNTNQYKMYDESTVTSTVGVPGIGNSPGTPGEKGGCDGKEVDAGSPGSPGSVGGNGTYEGTVDYRHFAITTASEYKIYSTAVTASNAWEQPLVSIGSASEQAFIKQLLTVSGNANGTFWIGLSIIKLISGDFANGEVLLKTYDGTYIKIIKKNGNVVNAYRVAVDDNKNITEVIGEAYTNFNTGEPNNSGNNEYYMHLTTSAKWNDNAESVTFGYITEESLTPASKNTTGYNALIVGGICGYNVGKIDLVYNVAKVSANKAYSAQSGISAYAGGITGYNTKEISNAYNIGAVDATVFTGSMSFYADVYAAGIANNAENISVKGYKNESMSVVGVPYSANGLTNGERGITIETSDGFSEEEIVNYWKNSTLVIESVGSTDYLANTEFDKSTLSITFNGVAVNDYNVQYNFLKERTSIVMISYMSETETYIRYIPVVVGAASPEKLDIYMEPKMDYYVGDVFSAEGLLLKLIYNNGTEKLLTSKDYVISSAPNENDMLVIGKHTVTVKYMLDDVNYLVVEYDINVEAIRVVEIQVTQLPDKLTYAQNEQIDLTGMQVAKVYNNGDTEIVPNSQLSINYSFMKVGETTITVNYNGFEATFQCTVTPVETDATITLESKTCSAGGTVQVPIVVSNNPGIASALLTISYDESILTLMEVNDTKIISGGMHSDTLASPYQLTWMNQTLKENITENGTIAILVFQISADAGVGDYEINISYDLENYDIVNADMEAVFFNTIDATITVLDVMYGDVNRDGRVNLIDSTILARYVAKWPDYPASSLDLQAADVNNDGRVNLLDSTILARHVAKWTDYAELPYIN